MIAKIHIENKKEEMDKQKQDVATYYNMIDELLKKINEVGLHMFWVDQRPGRKKLNKGLEFSVEIFPASLSKDSRLTALYINVHNAKALDIINPILQNYSDKYHSLEDIDIDTYF